MLVGDANGIDQAHVCLSRRRDQAHDVIALNEFVVRYRQTDDALGLPVKVDCADFRAVQENFDLMRLLGHALQSDLKLRVRGRELRLDGQAGGELRGPLSALEVPVTDDAGHAARQHHAERGDEDEAHQREPRDQARSTDMRTHGSRRRSASPLRA